MKFKTTLLWLSAVILFFSNCIFAAEESALQRAPETSSSSVSITFLDIEAGKAAIIDDSIDPYFSRLQPMEMSAKTGSVIDGRTLEEQRGNCRKRYQAGVRQFSDEEKEVLRKCIEGLYPALRQQYPIFADMPWSFLKTSNKIEGGLSYTRDKHIVLSERTCERIVRLHQSDPKRAFVSFSGLMVHEQMHVFQRVNPGLFDSLYIDVWGFVKAKEIEGCPWLTEHNLINPDGTDCCWVFPVRRDESTVYILPLVVFAEGIGVKRMPRDFRMIAVELVKSDGLFRAKLAEDGVPEFKNLQEVSEYRAVFPYTMNIYHPNETCASMFTDIVMADFFTPAGEKPEKVERELDRLRKWFTENLKEKPLGKSSGTVKQ